MATISQDTAKEISKAAGAQNPSNERAKRVTESTRIPMNLPTPKLSVPEMPGYYLYWHLGKNVPRALQAGYTFVDPEEVTINQTGIANDMGADGSTDMGSRVSIAAGESGNDREADRLYLMKLPLEWHQEDVNRLAQVNESVAVALRAGNIGADEDPDRNKRYMKQGQDLFYPKARR